MNIDRNSEAQKGCSYPFAGRDRTQEMSTGERVLQGKATEPRDRKEENERRAAGR